MYSAATSGAHYAGMTIRTEPTIKVTPRAARRLMSDYPRLSRRDAEVYVTRLIKEGRKRPTPRHWMRPGRFTPGTRFVYSCLEPDYCVLTRDGVATDLIVRGDTLGSPRRSRPPRREAECFDWRAIDLDEEID